MKDNIFNTYGSYYDLLYHDKDYPAEVEYIKKLLHAHGLGGGKLLEFGSGTGKHGCLLAKSGFQVTGIERSEEMVSKAQKCEGFKMLLGDIRDVNLDETFDGLISLFHVVSYLTSWSDIRAVFATAFKHLKSGGLFIFDVWYTPAVYSVKPSLRVKNLCNDHFDLIRIAEPTIHYNDNAVDINYKFIVKKLIDESIEIFTETHKMRHFGFTEIELISDLCGFNVVNAEEFLTGKKLSDQTWGACFVLRKV